MRSWKNKLLALFALVLILPVTGCATIMGGGTQLVTVSSAPSEATITADPSAGTFTTPASIELERKFAYTLTATKEGYRSATARLNKKMRVGPLIADILLTGLLGVIVDGVTGAWYELNPSNVVLALEQSNPMDEGPDVIEVTLSVDEEKDGLTKIHATSPVQIEVTRN